MARYDRVDEAIIHARPEEVWSALQREFVGQTHWWLPELGFRPLRDASEFAVGAEVEVVPAAGRAGFGPSALSFLARVVEVVENERLSAEYVAGAFRGRGDWTLEPVDEGTRLRMGWQVETHGTVPTLLGLFVDIGESHSRAMRAGFRRLDKLLAAERTGARSAALAP